MNLLLSLIVLEIAKISVSVPSKPEASPCPILCKEGSPLDFINRIKAVLDLARIALHLHHVTFQ